MAIGLVFIFLMTLICVIGIELNARMQFFLLAAEVIVLRRSIRRSTGSTHSRSQTPVRLPMVWSLRSSSTGVGTPQ